MKVAIIGGGISGLSTAYYLKKLAVPVSEIAVFEASSRFGGWIESKQLNIDDNRVLFEKGPRTLRLSTGDLKELNSLQLANDLELSESIDLVSKSHPAALNRYIYINNKVNKVAPKLIGKSEFTPKGFIRHGYNELLTKSRDESVEDESIHSFISRRFDSSIADNMLDPVFKGIVGGNIKELSASMFLKAFYDYEKNYGSIGKGLLMKLRGLVPPPDESDFLDLVEMRKTFYPGYSVWRMKNGLQELSDKLVKVLRENNVSLHSNEPVEKLEFNNDKTGSVKVKTKSLNSDFDLVISSIYSKNLSYMLPEKYSKLKNLLGKIQSVNMVVMNFYFNQQVLPLKGFGYLVPSNQKSPILGCIFDSVFNDESQNFTVLTVMMGGAWYDEYVGNKSEQEIYMTAFGELKRHLNLSSEPNYYEMSVMKNAIPQYKVGHEKLLNEIHECLDDDDLDNRLYLTGYSYEGVGVNDVLFNARKLVQRKLSNNELAKMSKKD